MSESFKNNSDSVVSVRQKRGKEQNSDEIDLGYLLAICLGHKWLIISVAIFVTMLGYLYATLATPIYRADALLQVEGSQGNLSSLDMNALGQESGGSSTQTEILRSRMILGRAAEQAGLDLVVIPNYFPVIGAAMVRIGVARPGFAEGSEHVWAGDEIAVEDLQVDQSLLGQSLTIQITDEDSYRLLDPLDREIGVGYSGQRFSSETPYVELLVSQINAPVNTRFTVLKRTEAQMIRNLQSRFQVAARGRDTGILELALQGPDQHELVRSLDAITNVYLVQNINRQAAEAESRLEFLEQQTPLIQEELNSAENRLNNYKASQDSVDLSFETRTMLQRLVALESELNQLEFQESELSRRFTPSHPSYRTLIAKREQLERERDRLEEQSDELPETQRQVLRLNRDVDVSQSIYMQMLNATQELRIARAGTVGNVRILDNAVSGTVPIAPQKDLIIAGSLIAGVILGLIFVFMRQLLRRGIESIDQLQALGLQVYATIPLSERQRRLFDRFKDRKWRHRIRAAFGNTMADTMGKARKFRRAKDEDGVLALIDPSDFAIEALRSLRTSLHFAMLEAGNKRLMLTGPSPAVGKSFVSANLAATCAQSGQRVLLIDADLRKGHIHRSFKGESAEGLSDYLVGDCSLETVVRATDQNNLNYISRGTAPPNPSELLMTKRFSEFLDGIESEYDLIIIDTPPALAVTDAAVVGKLVGTTLLITRFRENPVKEVERSLEQLENAGVVVNGCIFNAVERTASSYYGYGYAYGYYHYAYKSDDE